ncbi:hypothetical protein Tsubulata_033520 [Turnera subulata]|uniref:Uncharacterized protein n=1 Tax=Turnera subulata TaxID=218843 RepID=A0A9Q0FSM3_9ROSI|nr:hypothetical protein Tsubulata_033520 [Turnera subulata]
MVSKTIQWLLCKEQYPVAYNIDSIELPTVYFPLGLVSSDSRCDQELLAIRMLYTIVDQTYWLGQVGRSLRLTRYSSSIASSIQRTTRCVFIHKQGCCPSVGTSSSFGAVFTYSSFGFATLACPVSKAIFVTDISPKVDSRIVLKTQRGCTPSTVVSVAPSLSSGAILTRHHVYSGLAPQLRYASLPQQAYASSDNHEHCKETTAGIPRVGRVVALLGDSTDGVVESRLLLLNFRPSYIDVISSAFEGKSIVDRQRMVYKAIWEEPQNIVHAVDQMVTRTPAEAADKI